jgi:hypothetical protein
VQQIQAAVQWNGMLKNSRSHLAVQHQPLLTESDVSERGHNENWSLDSIPTVLMQTSEATMMTTTFKNDALRRHSNVILNEESLCKILKVYDVESEGNLISDFEFRNGKYCI